MNFADKKWLSIIGILLALYVFSRLWNLDASCLWFDEIFSVHAATLPVKDLFRFVAQDLIHPPLFYILLKIWILLGGESLFWLRLFPFFFSALSLAPFFLLGRELRLSPAVVALALFFLASSAPLIRYAQEVRMYGVLMFFSLTSLWLLARFLRGGKGFWWLTVVNILLVYTQYHGWLVVGAETAAIFFLAREQFKRALIMPAAVFASFLPWMYAVLTAMRVNADLKQNLGWAAKPDLQTVLYFLLDLHQPAVFLQSSAEDRRLLFFAVPFLLIGLASLAVYFGGRKKLSDAEKKRGILLLTFILVPLATAFAASWILPFSVWGTRHAIFIYAPFYILAAAALLKIYSRTSKTVLLTIVFSASAAAFAFHVSRANPVYIWCAWENLAREAQRETSGETEKIYAFEDLTAYHLWFALRKTGGNFEIYKVENVQPEDKAYFLPRGFDGVHRIDENGIEGEKFRIAFRARRWNEARQPLAGLLQKGFRLGAPQIYEAEGVKAFLVTAEK